MRSRPPRANPVAGIDDWLNLVDPDGAFITGVQLRAAFPHGFDPMPAELRAELRSLLAGADEDVSGRSMLRDWMLRTVLDWGDLLVDGQQIPATALVRAVEHGVQLRPAMALVDADDANRVRVGVFVWPTGTRLDRRPDVAVAGDTWTASPVQRAETWCRESGVPLALVTDDDHWVLAWAPRGAPAASCRWRLSDLADERILQAGLVSLLGARRFFAVADDDTLERLFERAADAEAEITKGLGLSVRRSVELLVAAISRDNVASDGAVLRGVAAEEVYEAAVTVLMRLVFLLFAEERRLLPAEDPLWAESYSVLTVRDQLRELELIIGESAMDDRHDAWHRLLATFRAVHGGVNHDRLTMPAYGGSLFDPDRFAFLEGRRTDPDDGPGPGRPVKIDDRTVLAILEALLTIQVRSGRGRVAQRVSYKALDVEQIGHCYEGLLDHGAARVDVLALGLVGPDGGEPEIAIDDLEARAASGADALCEWLSDKTLAGRTPSALAGLLGKQPDGIELARLRVACGHDDANVERVKPFWGLIRNDLRDLPIVLLPDSLYVTQTSTRRNMGAQYTTKALAEEVAQYALEPLVYEPGPQNEPERERWQLRRPEEILGLRVCDPAVGSGAILTAAGRYLADRLVEAVIEHGPSESPFAERLAQLAAASVEEQVTLARREVVDHCLYGVDKNPVAAEMAKLSLWLTTMAKERPFTFLDHAIQTGDSLLGITDIEQLRWLDLDPSRRKGQSGFQTLALDTRIKEATDLARRLQDLSVVTVRDATEKQRLHQELRTKLSDLSIVADAIVGAALSTAGKRGLTMEERLSTQLDRIRVALSDTSSEVEQSAALATLESFATGWLRTDLPDEIPMPWERQCLHWPLAFPEVFLSEGRTKFDAVVANPPFLGGKRISGANGVAYREHLVTAVANSEPGSADLVAYFILRMSALAATFGSLATNTISQGDTREVCLDRLVNNEWSIYRALKSEPWPNEASLEIAKVWMTCRPWRADAVLDGARVQQVSSSLERRSRVTGPPLALAANAGSSFIGAYLWGEGFVLDEDQAQSLLANDPRNRDVLGAFLTGRDLNEDPMQRPSRWVINFHDWPLERAKTYPDCFELVERLVRPVRAKVKRAAYRERWWRYAEPGFARDEAVAGLSKVLAIALVSKLALPAWIPNGYVVGHKCGVFAYQDDCHFALLSSSTHWWWAVRWSSSLGGIGNINYSPTDVFETFPQPQPLFEGAWEELSELGRLLDEFRRSLMVRSNLGLTKTYNRVHDPAEHDADIVRLRELHVELDYAVRDAYGWSDLALDHHHWETPQGVRFTVSPAAKDELLDRLLELNHERYAEEVAAGLHEKKTKKAPAKRARAASADQGSLL